MNTSEPSPHPPILARVLVSATLPRGILRESIRGDLEEEFHRRVERQSLESARRWYRRQALHVLFRYALVRDLLRVLPGFTPYTRPRGEGPPFWGFRQDLRHGVRVLKKNPFISGVAVLALALGIGANTAIFSVVNAVILRPLPFENPQRMVQIWEESPSHPGREMQLSRSTYADYRNLNTSFSHMSPIRPDQLYSGGSESLEEIRGMHLSSGYLEMAGLRPVLGRFFLPKEDEYPAPAVAVISHDYWQSEFGGRDVVGETHRIRDWISPEPNAWVPIDFEIVGILPPEFELPPLRKAHDFGPTPTPQVVLPLGRWTWGGDRRDMYSLRTVAELKEGVTIQQARADLEAIAAGIEEAHPETRTGFSVVVTPMPDLLNQEYGRALYFLWAATGLILLISCANVASLLLGRALSRERELALRATLGAGRRRLFRQLLTESSLLALAGGVVGLLLAFWGTRILIGLGPGTIHRLDEASIDPGVLLFSLGLSVVTVLMFGLLPALRGSRLDLADTLKTGGHGATFGRLRSLHALVAAEVAMSLVLLVGAGLMLQSLIRLVREDVGLEREHLVVVNIHRPHAQLSKYNTDLAMLNLNGALRERIEAVPGVISSASSYSAPLSRSPTIDVTMADRPPPAPGEWISAAHRNVSPGYFETLRTPVLRGRVIQAEDLEAYREVLLLPRPWPLESYLRRIAVVVNERFARHFWPGEDPLGKVFYWGRQDPEIVAATLGKVRWSEDWDPRELTPRPLTVVGVVADVKVGLADEAPITFYLVPFFTPDNILIRTATDPGPMLETLRREIEAVDPSEISVSRIRTMEQVVSEQSAESRFRTVLVGSFAGLAALLTALGLFGVLAYAVGQRSREIGVRISLGARRTDVTTMVLGMGIKLSGVGILMGLAVVLASGRFVSSLLFEVSPTDPVAIAGAALLLCAVALTACYLPVRRAGRVDPMEVLRED